MGEWPTQATAKLRFADRLRTLRRSAGLTQIELGLRIGVDRTFVTKLERGKTSPTMWTILRLAWGLDVNPGALVDDLLPQPTLPAPT